MGWGLAVTMGCGPAMTMGRGWPCAGLTSLYHRATGARDKPGHDAGWRKRRIMSNANVIERGPGEMMGNAGPGMLAGLRVIEVADERAEYTGLLLAGLGAEVVKVEPPEGNATRRIGPFLDDEPGLERSLFFWNYNRNKKSVVLDLRETMAREHMLRLLEGADILLDASCGGAERSAGAGSWRDECAVSLAGDGTHDAVRR